MPAKVSVPDDFFASGVRPSVFDCLSSGNVFRFVKGTDFAEGSKPENLIARAKLWAASRDLMIQAKIEAKGDIVMRAVAMTEEQIAKRRIRSAEAKDRRRAKVGAEANAEASAVANATPEPPTYL